MIEALDRDSAPEDVSDRLGDGTTVEEVAEILRTLAEHGAIKETTSEDPDLESAWHAFVRYGELPPPEQLRALSVIGPPEVEPLLEGSSALGVRYQRTDPAEADWEDLAPAPTHRDSTAVEPGRIPVRRDDVPVVALARDDRRGEPLRINEQAVAAGVPVLFAAVAGVDLRIGPYVVPGRTACWWETERQWARASADRPQYETLQRVREREGAPELPVVGGAAMSTALGPWLLELALRGTSSLAGEAVHVRATTLQTSRHSVMRLPRCPVCLPMQPLVRNPLY